MTVKEIIDKLKERFGEKVLKTFETAKDPSIIVSSDIVHDILVMLKIDPMFDFNFLMSLCAVDLKGLEETNNFRIVYHLFSYKYKYSFIVKTDLHRENPAVQSASDIWPAAIFYERETFDLFGIKFNGNPDLRRILLPPEWEGHPLRKDYVEGDVTLGISTKRESSIELLKKK